MARAEWIDRMKERTVNDVARVLGFEVAESRGQASGGSMPCPSCNAPKRHTKRRDKRGAAGIRSDRRGWRCYQCDESGDVIDVVAWTQAGNAYSKCDNDGKAAVRSWCMDFLGILPTDAPTRRYEPKPAPVVVSLPEYPPADEVAALWSSAPPVTDDPDVVRWLEVERPNHPKGHARIDAEAVARMDLARVLPPDAECPTWAGFETPQGGAWRSYPSVGSRMIVPLFDVTGAMRSLVFRRVFESDRSKHKSSAARGYQRQGLAFMCQVARRIFDARELPEWWANDRTDLYVAEGEMDFLAGAIHFETRAPVVGVFPGSWTKRYAASLPSDVGVVIRTDPDKGGIPLANAIASTLSPRTRRIRVRPEYEMIENGAGFEVRLRRDSE